MANRLQRSRRVGAIAGCIVVSNIALTMWLEVAMMLAPGPEETALEVALYIYPFPAVWIVCMVMLGLQVRHWPVIESGLGVALHYARLLRAASNSVEAWETVKWFLLMWCISFVLAESSRQIHKLWTRRHPGPVAEPRSEPPAA